ncbi:DNA circularization protein [Pseudomonas sp. YuFO8]|uniref:DNA circularization protein n=1 Tax=Pseudomonas sp. YuFO8 TaxID=3095361 RepID=UPI002B246D9B|nr:DNA circularization N-terminal domain-containing protein [Pseudomonas sp. YuFO8]MEB2621409.1 DNA circularization N-terminal domain-containing protein [Pseudomonas sp. YuFO8]
MSEWRDRKQGASFRGVPFQVDTDSVPVGRRTQLHEFPQRDQPFVEDLGRCTRHYKFTGFVAGDDCLAQRDRLLTALDKAGSGELVHPWFGRLTVTAGECEVSHARNEQGVVRFSLEFIDGMLAFPVQSPNTRRQLAGQAPSLLASIKGRFNAAMAPVDLARQRASALRSALAGAMGYALKFLQPASSLGTDLNGLVASLRNGPGAFADNLLAGISGLSRAFGGYGSSSSFQGSSAKATQVAALSASAPATEDIDVATIQAAVIALVQDAALLDLLLDMAEVPVAIRPGVSAPAALDVQLAQHGPTVAAGTAVETAVPVAEDVLVVRDAISEALWSVAGESPSDHFGTLSEARQAVDRHLTEVARSGVGLRRYAPAETMSALVLAHALYGDALRGGEIVERNRVRHPGFVPATDLQVAKA